MFYTLVFVLCMNFLVCVGHSERTAGMEDPSLYLQLEEPKGIVYSSRRPLAWDATCPDTFRVSI